MYASPQTVTETQKRQLAISEIARLLEAGWQRTEEDLWMRPTSDELFTRAGALQFQRQACKK